MNKLKKGQFCVQQHEKLCYIMGTYYLNLDFNAPSILIKSSSMEIHLCTNSVYIYYICIYKNKIAVLVLTKLSVFVVSDTSHCIF